MIPRRYQLKRTEEDRKADESKSLLPQTVKNLMKLIADLSGIRSSMVDIGLDWRLMPLGRLTAAQIKQGYEILEKIQQTIDTIQLLSNAKGKKLTENSNEIQRLRNKLPALSNEFYMLIPHNFYGAKGSNAWGYARPEEISTTALVRTKLNMLDSLTNIEIATNLIVTPPKSDAQSQLDAIYDSLGVDIEEVDAKSQEFNLVHVMIILIIITIIMTIMIMIIICLFAFISFILFIYI